MPMTRFLLFCCCILVGSTLLAQSGRWQYGFSLGFEAVNLVAGPLSTPPDVGLLEAQINNNPGYSLGIVGRYRLADPLYFRTGANTLFSNNSISFRWSDNEMHREDFQLFSVFAPFVLEFQNDKLPLHPLCFAGVVYAYQYAVRDRPVVELPIKSHDLAIHFGLGSLIRLPGFAIRPEVSFTLGLTNWLLLPPQERYRVAVKDVHRDVISVRVVVLKL